MDDHKKQLFDTQLGQRATIQRSDESSEAIAIENRKLKGIGEAMNPLPKNLTYEGSAAIHIYYNSTLEQAFFVSQVRTLGNCNELLAIAGMTDLKHAAMEHFGHRRPKLRSNF